VQEVAASLVSPARQLFLDRYDDMRMRVAGNIVSLAFRRALQQHRIPHEYVPPVSFTEPDRMEISIGGRLGVPVVQLDSSSEELLMVEVDRPDAPSLAAMPTHRGAPVYRGVDVLVFIHLEAGLTRSREALDRALAAGAEVFLLHALPSAWSQPHNWTGLGRLVIKSDTSEDLDLTLYGQDNLRNSLTRALSLPARRRTGLEEGFFALGGVHSAAIPSAPVGMFSPALDDLHLIHPYQWGNIRVYPRQITVAGFEIGQVVAGPLCRAGQPLPGGN
jgi:hypothetical protein